MQQKSGFFQGVSLFAIGASRPRQTAMVQGVKLFCNRHGYIGIRLGGIAKQKTVDSSAEGASVLMGSWREPLRLTLHVSTRKRASLPSGPLVTPLAVLT